MIKYRNDLTQEYVKSILNYDQKSGILTWKISKATWIKIGLPAGTLHYQGYLRIFIDGKLYAAHRLVWLYMTGEWPKEDTDHIDMNKTNNKWNNLREATRSENKGNGRKHKDNKSGLKGVSWHKGNKKWQAQIEINNKNISLGYYLTKEEAGLAYKNAAIKYFGQFARTE